MSSPYDGDSDILSAMSTDQSLADDIDPMTIDDDDSMTDSDFEYDDYETTTDKERLRGELQEELGCLSPYNKRYDDVSRNDAPWLLDINDLDTPPITAPTTFLLSGPEMNWVQLPLDPTESTDDGKAPLVTLRIANDTAARKRWREFLSQTSSATGALWPPHVLMPLRAGVPQDDTDVPSLPLIPLARAFKRVHVDLGLAPEMPFSVVLPAVLEGVKYGLMLDELSIHLRPTEGRGVRGHATTVASEVKRWSREDVECEGEVVLTESFGGREVRDAVAWSMEVEKQRLSERNGA